MNAWTMADPLMRHQGEKVLLHLKGAGHQAYFVGGCVRDELMRQPIHDMDIATSAKPEETLALFERTVPTGIQHGTVTVLMEDQAYEVTTFRKEADYEDHRHPTSVEFVDLLHEDLCRRDFTMNAIAADENGVLTDPFGGRDDIAAGIIRCVGDPMERFEEDALRMMRAVRFAAVFGFRPVKSLWAALRAGRSKIRYIAVERIRSELEKMLLGPDPIRGLVLLQRSGLLEFVKAPVPETAILPISQSERLAWLAGIELVPTEHPAVRWSLLLQGLGVSGTDAADLMKKWTFSKAASQETSHIMSFDEAWSQVKLAAMDPLKKREQWVILELKFGKKTAEDWLMRQALLAQSDHRRVLSGLEAGTGPNEELEWHRQIRVYSVRELTLSGNEVLREAGIKGGPWLGELLDLLLLQVASGALENDRESLLQEAKEVLNRRGITG